MRGIQIVQFGLFLILLGFSVILAADVMMLVGVINLFNSEGAALGLKLVGLGAASLAVGTVVGALGKLLTVATPEKGARNLAIVSVVCDVVITILRLDGVQAALSSFLANLFIFILTLISFFVFLRFLTRMGDNVGAPAVGENVALIYAMLGTITASPAILIFSRFFFSLIFGVASLVAILIYNYSIYQLFKALPLYIEEVKMGITDPTESGEERKERERKERLKGPGGGGGPAPTKPPEEPQGTPPVGAKLYRIPKALEPLHLAVKEGDRYKVDTRLAQGDNPGEPVKHGLTPLHIAASVGVMDVADALIKAGAPVDATCEEGLTPLYFAVQTGNHNIVGFLLDKGANLFHQNAHGYTPLHWACCAPHPNFIGPARLKMANLLISQGADLNAKTKDGKTPRDLALENQLEELVSGLDRHLATPSAGRSFQQKPGDPFSRQQSGEPEKFKPFLGTHLSVIPKDLPPLHASVKEGDPEKIKLAVTEGGDITESVEGGLTPIHITAITGVMSGMDLLLSLGAGVNATCDFNLTPMFLAVHVNNLMMVGYLISRGADVNHQDEMGRTPLHWAAAAPQERLAGQNRVKMVEFLLQSGARKDIRDKDGKSALDLARAAEYDDVIKAFGAEEPDSGGGSKAEDDDYYV